MKIDNSKKLKKINLLVTVITCYKENPLLPEKNNWAIPAALVVATFLSVQV